MDALTVQTLILYSVMAILLFQQKLHLKNFHGASQIFGLLLGLSATLGTVTGLVFLFYFGWKASWVGALVLSVVGILSAGLLSVFLERLIGHLLLSLNAFVLWPTCAFILFQNVPHLK